MSLRSQYARPRNLAEAVAALDALGTGAVVIAGGQELMPVMNHGRLMPTVLVDINGLPELTGIRVEGRELSIGALTVHRQLQTDPLVAEHAALLAESSRQAGGGWQVHNRGTLGGNIVAFHPLYDILPPLLALQAVVEIAGPDGLRRVSIAALLKETSHGLGTSTLLTRVFVPLAEGNGRRAHNYQKLKATSGSYGSANAAALLSLRTDGRVGLLRVAIGAAGPQPADLSAEFVGFAGRPVNDALLTDVERIGAAAIREPLDDQQGEAGWRRAMAGLMARRAVAGAMRAMT
jgi:CO/xanthine dehydrogenase FAD-binding subunit